MDPGGIPKYHRYLSHSVYDCIPTASSGQTLSNNVNENTLIPATFVCE